MRRALQLGFAALALVALVLQACGGSTDGDLFRPSGSAGTTGGSMTGGSTSGGSMTAGTGTGGTTGGTSGGTAGTLSTGGSGGVTGGSGGSGGDGTGGTAGVATGGSAGTSSTTGGTAGTGNSPGGLDCDLRKIVCKRAQPMCDLMQVPSVEGTCYGECVPIMECGCIEAEDCPFADSYTCHRSAMRCGPYVN